MVAVLVIGIVLGKAKLLNWAALLVGAGQKGSKFFATVLKRVGSILLPRNCVRQGTPFTIRVVEGSKISPWKTGVPSQGFVPMGFKSVL